MNKYNINKKIKLNYGIYQNYILISVEKYQMNNSLFIQIELSIILIIRINSNKFNDNNN